MPFIKMGKFLQIRLYLTKVDIKVEGDVSLPDFDWESWKEMEEKTFLMKALE